MTDDDRQLLRDLRKMTDACGAFCAGVIAQDVTRDDQLALSDWLGDMGERVRKRALCTPVVIDGVIEEDAVLPARQPGDAGRVVREISSAVRSVREIGSRNIDGTV